MQGQILSYYIECYKLLPIKNFMNLFVVINKKAGSVKPYLSEMEPTCHISTNDHMKSEFQ
jgi:hypothetical protein